MTTNEFIVLLQRADPSGKRQVILQRDSEGNGYSPCADVWAGTYVPDSNWSGEAHIEVLTDELRKQGFSEEDLCQSTMGQAALFVTPIN